MNELALEICHVSKRFPPNVIALTDASLNVRPGEVHCLLGANGAGKSTLLRRAMIPANNGEEALVPESEERYPLS